MTIYIPKDKAIKQRLEDLAETVKHAHKTAYIAIGPGLAEFVSDFNGQPHGKSSASLKGKRVMIQSVELHSDGTYNFCAYRTECGRPINSGFFPEDVKFVES